MPAEPLKPVTCFTDIEDAAVAEIVRLVDQIRKAAVQRNMRFIFNNPAVTAAIFSTGRFEPTGQKSYWIPCELHVELQVTNAKGEEERRRDSNPLLMLILLALTQKKLGLKLKDPGLVPGKITEVTDEQDWKENKIVWDIEFGCTFAIEKPADEDEGPLLEIGLKYLLEPGDGETDAEDVVTFDPQGGK